MDNKIKKFEELFYKFIEDYGTSPIIEVYEDKEGLSIDWDTKFYDKAQDLFDDCDELAGLFVNRILQRYLEDMQK